MTSVATGLAAVTDCAGGFRIERIEVDPPGPGEVRVRMTAAGVCHTDHASLGWPGPLVMGHEGAGTVELVGEGVTSVAPGDPVLLNWAIPCGQCPQCQCGAQALCDRTLETNPQRYGTSRAHSGATRLAGRPIERSFNLGTFAEVTVVCSEALTKLPAQLPAQHACILGCAVMTGIGSAINIAAVQPGDTVAVVGCGGVGLNVIQGARLAGAGTIIAIDRRRPPLDRASRFGATELLVAEGDDDLVETVLELTDRRGVDHAFEATGSASLAFLPLRLARNGGNAVQVSGAHGEAAVELTRFFWNKRYLTPLYGGCVPERDFPRLFAWAQSGAIELAALIGKEYPLQDLGKAFDDMLSGRSAKGVLQIA